MPHGTKICIGPGDIVLDGTLLPPPKKGAQPPILYPCLLCRNGWIDQDVGPGPRHIMSDGDPGPLQKKAHHPPVFGPSLLWPNGWIDQDATWYEGRPRCRPHCVRWGPSSPPPKRGEQLPPIYGPCLLWPNGWIDTNWYEDKRRPRRHCVMWGPSSSRKRGIAPTFGPCLLWPSGCMDQDAIWYEGRPRPRPGTAPNFRPIFTVANGRPYQLLLSTCSKWRLSTVLRF